MAFVFLVMVKNESRIQEPLVIVCACKVCLCSGHVRFGSGSKWANEVLSVPRGIIGCKVMLSAAAKIMSRYARCPQSDFQVTNVFPYCEECGERFGDKI